MTYEGKIPQLPELNKKEGLFHTEADGREALQEFD